MGELQGLLWWGGEGEKNRIEISFFPSSEQCFAPQVYLLLIPSLDLVHLKPKPLPIRLGAILMILQNSKGLWMVELHTGFEKKIYLCIS